MEKQYVEYTVRDQIVKVLKIEYPINKNDAYLIGRIAGDGSYTFNEKKQFIRMGFTSKDYNIMKYLKELYCPNTQIIDRSNREININNGYKTYNYKNLESYELHFPIRLTEQFSKHGIVCKKQDRVIACIPDNLFSCAMLGFFDSDGSIAVRHRKDCRTPRLNMILTSSAEKILKHTQRHLENKLNISCSIYKEKNFSRLKIENTKKCIEFFDWLYSELPDFFCYKKKNIFDQYMSCVRLGEFREGHNSE